MGKPVSKAQQRAILQSFMESDEGIRELRSILHAYVEGHAQYMEDGYPLDLLVEAWEAGLERKAPEFVKDCLVLEYVLAFKEQLGRERDPEYQEYVRLKAKFEEE